MPSKSPPSSDLPPVVLSEGAGIALGNVFNRLIKQPTDAQKKTTGKRPRASNAPVVLVESQEVRESLEHEREEKRKAKEAKRVKRTFETNARVIPDAATGAALEKQLLETATKGAVALFNAVAKSQKGGEGIGGKGEVVSRESFMSMMRGGVGKAGGGIKEGADVEDDSKGKKKVRAKGGVKVEEESSEDDEENNDDTAGAKWLREDFLTKGSQRLRDWGKEGESDSSDEDESEEEDGGSEEN